MIFHHPKSTQNLTEPILPCQRSISDTVAPLARRGKGAITEQQAALASKSEAADLVAACDAQVASAMPAVGNPKAHGSRGESPADWIHHGFRVAHTATEAANFVPILYLAWKWLLTHKPQHCDEEQPWMGWDEYTIRGVTYANPCDIYNALVLAAHPLHMIVSAAALVGAFGVLTKCFWANDFVLKQYAVASGCGVVGSIVACVGCMGLYNAMGDYEYFIEAQPETSKWRIDASVREQSEQLKTYMTYFALFFMWNFVVLGVRAAATALAVRYEFFGKELRLSMPALLGGGGQDSSESVARESSGGDGEETMSRP